MTNMRIVKKFKRAEPDGTALASSREISISHISNLPLSMALADETPSR
jgi:hypothetical protein